MSDSEMSDTIDVALSSSIALLPKVGSISGIVSAAGGMGGYFPPLVMGATYNAEHNSYFVGLTLLAGFAILSLLLALTVRNGGKVDERTHP